MSWEAFRLTSKSPTEVMHVLGPHGVDDLIRKMMDTVWRDYPEDSRSFENVRKRVGEVYARNMKHWSSIRKPAPAAFFDNLLPYAADGFMRQAFVLAWMMMPRAGGREFSDVKKIVARIFERNLAAWDADNLTFTATASKKRPPGKPAGKTKKSKASVTKKKSAKRPKKR
jgi:hypothetical protein